MKKKSLVAFLFMSFVYAFAVTNNWTLITTPSAAADIRHIGINSSNGHLYLIDRAQGFYVSTDFGVTWTQRNSGLPTTSGGNVLGWSVNWDAHDSQVIISLCSGTTTCDDLSGGGTLSVTFWRSSNEGVSWTQIPMPSALGTPTTQGTVGSFNGTATAGNGNLVGGIHDSIGGTCGAWYSSDGGVTTHAASCPANANAPAPGGTWSITYNPVLNILMLGTEQAGLYCSTDNGQTYSPCSPPKTGFTGGIRDGNVDATTYDASGNILMATQGGIWKSSGTLGGGFSWTNIFGNSNTSEGYGLGTDFYGNIYYTHKQDTNAPVCPPSCTNPTNAGTTPVYVSTNGGTSWAPLSTGLTTAIDSWALLQNPIDGQLYVVEQVPSTDLGTVFRTNALGSGENAYCTGTTDSTCFTGSLTDGPAALPTSGMYTGLNGTPAPGSTVTLTCGANLQTAINSLTAGQTLVIPAMCSGSQDVITGNFTLPVVTGADANHWNIIETDQTANSAFPAEHIRATPCAINLSSVTWYPNYPCASAAFLMPQIVNQNSGGQSAITVATGAHYWRIIGLEIVQPNSFSNDGCGLIDLSGNTCTGSTTTTQSDHIIFDRDLIHGQPDGCILSGGSYSCTGLDLKNGIQLTNSTNVATISSWLYNIDCPQQTCTDSHAFGGGNGDAAQHTYKIWNDMVEAAGENFIMGGAGDGTSAAGVPTDFEIRQSWFFKPAYLALQTAGGNGCGNNSCGGTHPEQKNNMEWKNVQRALIEGNEFENDWMGWSTDQSGYMSVVGPRNQNLSYNVTATSDGAGNLVATSGTFLSNATSSLCAIPNHCHVAINQQLNQASWKAVTWTDSTHLSVIGIGGSGFPASGSGLTVSVCEPGENPNAIGTDLVYRYNEFRNGTNGIEVSNPPSDCGDLSLGTTRVELHDNLFHGINSNNNNASSGNKLARCIFRFNSQATGVLTSVQAEHNMCAIAQSGTFGNSGLDVTEDGIDTTTDGSTGSYLSNMVTQNNIGGAGGIFTYASGLYPGGATAGLKQQSCTPPVTGTTCTWTYTENVLGQNLWNSQTFNSPFPSTNQTCGNSGSPTATCFPSGSTFTSLFTNYNGPLGQPGYLGNYQLLLNGAYNGAGTDGKDPGVSDWSEFLGLTSAVRTSVSYAAASITSTSLPNASVGIAYSQQLAGTSASDFQYWTLASGSLCSGLSLSNAGVISGTPSGAGSCTFTAQMMDAAQQYATQSLTLTVGSSAPQPAPDAAILAQAGAKVRELSGPNAAWQFAGAVRRSRSGKRKSSRAFGMRDRRSPG